LAEAMEGAVGSVGYQLSAASYDSKSFSVASQDTSPKGLAFNNDGTKMYLCGEQNDTIYQYSLSSSYDVSTASYDSVSFSVTAQDVIPNGISFKSDGTKMYIVGGNNDAIYQYTLSTAWDLSTASYDSVSLSVSSQDASPYALTFKTDGTVLYILGAANKKVFQYTLSTAWDLSSASYVLESVSVNAQDTFPTGVSLSSDGAKMFISGATNDSVYEYSLSTNWDVSTASYASVSFSAASQDSVVFNLVFNSDGTKMYIVGAGNDAIFQYSTSTSSYTNQMDKTQLDAVTDPNHIALGDDLDLSIIFNMTSGTTVPSSDGVAINYDANVLNKGAVLGTDYDFDAPAGNSVRVTALTAGNFKVRVV
jgi:hypothetical protein